MNPFYICGMKKIYHLGTCSTCARILKEINADNSFELQDIKTEQMTEAQVDEMAKKAGSYEAIFSRKAMKYRALGLNEKTLSESDYKNYILEEYTFLKRPVMLIGDDIYVGNSKKVVAAAIERLNE